MALQGATVTVAAGATSAAVTGVFGSSYQVQITAGWVTGFRVTSKTAAGFTVEFAVPAFGTTLAFDWIVSTTATGAATSQAITSATVAVAAAATSKAIALSASLPATYQVGISTSWVTDVRVTGKTAAGFTVEFAVPPAAAGELDYTIYGPAIGTVSLTDYLRELRDLLHDPNDRFWSAIQKGDYINQAMKRRDIDTAVNRSTISYTLTSGTGRYTFTTLGNGQIVDILNIFLILGTTRALLDNPPLSTLNELWRYSTTQSGRTAAWSRQGPATVIFGPTPGSAYPIEIDAVVYGSPLVSLTDTDPLPYPYTQPVPYYAAYLAKINERESDEKNEFWDAYQELVGFATSGRAPQMPSAGRR